MASSSAPVSLSTFYSSSPFILRLAWHSIQQPTAKAYKEQPEVELGGREEEEEIEQKASSHCRRCDIGLSVVIVCFCWSAVGGGAGERTVRVGNVEGRRRRC